MKFDLYNTGNDYPQFGRVRITRPTKQDNEKEEVDFESITVAIAFGEDGNLDIILNNTNKSEIDNIQVTLTPKD